MKLNTFSTFEEKIVKCCRICWQSNQQTNNKLIEPCACLGSIAYVHEGCLLKHLFLRTKGTLVNAACQICLQRIPISTIEDRRLLRDWGAIGRRLTRDQVLILALLFVIEVLVFFYQDSTELLDRWRRGSLLVRFGLLICLFILIGGFLQSLELIYKHLSQPYLRCRIQAQRRPYALVNQEEP